MKEKLLDLINALENAQTHKECNDIYNQMDKVLWQIYDNKIIELHKSRDNESGRMRD